MTATTVDAADVEYILSLSDEDLAAELVTAGAGTEYDDPGVESALMMVAKISKSSTALPGNWFLERAERMFRRAWPTIRGPICRAYKDNPELEFGGVEWLTYLINVVAPGSGIGSRLVARLIRLAAKEGLDALCEVDT